MLPDMASWIKIILAGLLALAVSYLMTPPVKSFAERVGAIDEPSERRINTVPVPRMGGLAIFFGFVLSLLLFVDMSTKVTGLLLGAVIIAVMGAVDDIVSLNPWVKLAGQVVAALVAIRCGIVFDAVSNPNFLSQNTTIEIGFLSIPLTVFWIVACTNAVNLIDGLDGLAVGVSAISSLTMLVVALFVSEPSVAVILAALTGACLGFMPYNLNPAKIFMGDVGSQFLGFVLSTVSIMGLFKFHAIITFLVPLLALAVPLADTVFAFFRRILKGQSPFHPDRGHFHHRLMDSGLDQKQAVALLYGISALLGLVAVLLAGHNAIVRIVCLVAGFGISITVWLFVFRHNPGLRPDLRGDREESGEKESKDSK
ncbi:MAG: undecaprenyl/decaprenyl-phosphate alpha-N-acetylglucosaminyl 1-phosphate transferase [Oscillospiraceae bacterium]|nr:undecaprenyl/decaprenyl-phosphate alpha-N-acetylglucosaminyl 1-phosphate transferase [Oscillospiraceae bacterium]